MKPVRQRTMRKRSRRWVRLVVPPVAALVVILAGLVLYRMEQPGVKDATYLSPDSTAAIGASDLAGRVRAAGVTIIPEKKSSDALVAAFSGDATLLITTPELVNPFYLRMLKLMPASTRVVVVEPGESTVQDGYLPFRAAQRRYSARAADPHCDYAPAAQAGRAGVVRTQYAALWADLGKELNRCYDSSLVVYRRDTATIAVVGSADPFRNDRIGEYNNAKLAVGLLTGAPRLVWLDLHKPEPPPLITNDPALAGAPAAPPSLRPNASSDPGDTDFPTKSKAKVQAPPPPPQGSGEDPPPRADPPNPLWEAFPPWVYVTTALLAVCVLLLAFARARRLGAPVVEPLPVVVRSGETVTGRGRLYQRAKARPTALQVLRDAALVRLARLLRLDPAVERTLLVEAVAARSGWAPGAVEHILFGPPPGSDEELVDAATQLERLVSAVATEQPGAQPAPDAIFEGEPR